MRVAGIDYSTRFVDLVTVPYEGAEMPVWERFPLMGADAFDRARSVADSLPGRSSAIWEDILAVGIEHPGGNHGTGHMLRVQGAILARIPARMLVHPLPPGKWRKLVGLAGNATKNEVAEHALVDLHSLGHLWTLRDNGQDCLDAYCIALATLALINHKQAA